jgi:hypothetical protein
MQTLYRTATPEAIHAPETPEDHHPGEYRQLVIRNTPENTSGSWTFTQRQGWYFEDEKRAIHPRIQLEEHFETYEKAEAFYKNQLQYLKSMGYVHSFTPYYYGPDKGSEYELLNP